MPIKFYLYIFIIIFSKPAFSEIINENNLFKREGLFFNKFTNELFTGSVESFDATVSALSTGPTASVKFTGSERLLCLHIRKHRYYSENYDTG